MTTKEIAEARGITEEAVNALVALRGAMLAFEHYADEFSQTFSDVTAQYSGYVEDEMELMAPYESDEDDYELLQSSTLWLLGQQAP